MKTDKTDIKWFRPDSENGTCKQHAFKAKECKERYTLEPYPGNQSLCGTGFASDDGERAVAFTDLDNEPIIESKACKTCLKKYKAL